MQKRFSQMLLHQSRPVSFRRLVRKKNKKIGKTSAKIFLKRGLKFLNSLGTYKSSPSRICIEKGGPARSGEVRRGVRFCLLWFG